MKKFLVKIMLFIVVSSLAVGGICYILSGKLMLSLGATLGIFIGLCTIYLLHMLEMYMLWRRYDRMTKVMISGYELSRKFEANLYIGGER